jgi:hypothetical protein
VKEPLGTKTTTQEKRPVLHAGPSLGKSKELYGARPPIYGGAQIFVGIMV